MQLITNKKIVCNPRESERTACCVFLAQRIKGGGAVAENQIRDQRPPPVANQPVSQAGRDGVWWSENFCLRKQSKSEENLAKTCAAISWPEFSGISTRLTVLAWPKSILARRKSKENRKQKPNPKPTLHFGQQLLLIQLPLINFLATQPPGPGFQISGGDISHKIHSISKNKFILFCINILLEYIYGLQSQIVWVSSTKKKTKIYRSRIQEYFKNSFKKLYQNFAKVFQFFVIFFFKAINEEKHFWLSKHFQHFRFVPV